MLPVAVRWWLVAASAGATLAADCQTELVASECCSTFSVEIAALYGRLPIDTDNDSRFQLKGLLSSLSELLRGLQI